MAVLETAFDAILFDMDGTLTDSTGAVNRAWHRWAVEQGFGDTFRGIQHGRPARDMVAELVVKGTVEESIARVQQLELADTEEITALPGAAELLASIPEARKAIVTSCARDLCAVRLAAAGIPAPLTVVTIEDTPRGKPNPDPFLAAAERLGVDPRRCLVVEDAPAGLEGARAAGCATIGVAGTHLASELAADFVVDGLDRLRVSVDEQGVRVHFLKH